MWDCSERQRYQGVRSDFGFGDVEPLELGSEFVERILKGCWGLRLENGLQYSCIKGNELVWCSRMSSFSKNYFGDLIFGIWYKLAHQFLIESISVISEKDSVHSLWDSTVNGCWLGLEEGIIPILVYLCLVLNQRAADLLFFFHFVNSLPPFKLR